MITAMRWINTLFAWAFISTFISKVSSEALFELELKKFINNGKDNEGNCCSGYKDRNGVCSDKCLTKFRVCLNVYQENINPHSKCSFGEKFTPVLGENTIDFARVDNFENPLEFKLDAWQGTFSLVIDALHEVNNGTKYYQGPTLVTRLMTKSWLKINSTWTEDLHSSGDTSLHYKYRVVCEEHYHGEGCRKWCSPRDDQFGHYTCNEQGDHLCLAGWKGPKTYCSEAICSEGCMGSCTRPNECTCKHGWTGARCDQCKVYPSCVHGTCDKPWQCNCMEGWGGMSCDKDLNYCTNHKPCKNGATCHNYAPGNYSCDCPAGYGGRNCEIVNDSCSNDPCQNGGTCLDTDNEGFVCQCKASFSGRFCELSGQTCADRLCQNHAPCSDTVSGFQCHCLEGFDGSVCENLLERCQVDTCLNGGSCLNVFDGLKCQCPTGFSGDRCHINMDDCFDHGCANGAKCIDGIGTYICQCPTGYTGRFCKERVTGCANSPCGNGGSCIATSGRFPNNDFTCICRPGFTGTLCQSKVSSCLVNPCENGGVCKEAPELVMGFRCSCPSQYVGPKCSFSQQQVALLSQNPSTNPEPPMSLVQIVLIVTFSVAVPVLVIISVVVIICMKRRRRNEMRYQDEEVRRQNELNAVHNAANNKNLAVHGSGMIFNSLDYPTKPLNTSVPGIHHVINIDNDYKKNVHENAYAIVPARSTKTLNTDVSSRLSLASKLEKELDACRNNTNSPDHHGSYNKSIDPHLPRTQSNNDVHMKRNSTNNYLSEVCASTNTLTSNCSPSTCTTPSSVYVIEEHLDENYIATEV